MKKVGKFLIAILLAVPMLIGTLFLSPNLAHNATQTAQNGGGGANSLNSEEKDDLNAKKQTWTTPTYKTYEDLFTDLDIKEETITEEDYTGAGSQANPYVIHSMRGFLWLTNLSKSKINLYKRYVMIDCDIVLNEETFDENGNPSGGDGTIYEWTPIPDCDRPYLEGGNNTIYGLYINKPTTNNLALFSSGLLEFNNVSFENVYINGNESVATVTTSYLTRCNNIKLSNGNLYGNKNVYGISSTTNLMLNCENNLNIMQKNYTTSGSFAGLVGEASDLMENCKNYGNISLQKGGFAGGLVVRVQHMKNCHNYGKVSTYGALTGIGGLVGYSQRFTSDDILVENSCNYGELSNPNNMNIYFGGIVGYLYSTTTIKNCNNYGYCQRVSGLSGGGYAAEYTFINCANYGKIENKNVFVSGVGNNYVFKDCTVDCEVVGTTNGILFSTISTGVKIYGLRANIIFSGNCSSSYFSLLGQLNSKIDIVLQDVKCVFEFKNAILDYTYLSLFAYAIRNNQTLIADDVQFDIISDENVKRPFMIRYVEGGDVNLQNMKVSLDCAKSYSLNFFQNVLKESVKMKNILIEEKSSTISVMGEVVNGDGSSYLKDRVEGLVRIAQNGTRKFLEFCGTDFSDFFVDFKTGKLGLKTFMGRGFYQGTVSEEVLLNKGFVKKTI